MIETVVVRGNAETGEYIVSYKELDGVGDSIAEAFYDLANNIEEESYRDYAP